jgi:leader peptidase (prepilin peptidase) / N-methyltransferase
MLAFFGKRDGVLIPVRWLRMEDCLRPNVGVLLSGTIVIALVSIASLPWQEAVASIVLGTLMLAGADVDARTYLLPDTVTIGTVVAGLVSAPIFDPAAPWLAIATAMARSLCVVLAVALVRRGYRTLRGREGLGFGDVKLAAGIGAWLPLGAIPICFALATIGALLSVLWHYSRGERLDGATKLPLGAYLCPALWLVFYIGAWTG